jgi:1-deoxy-D-xylulose-5-phosphate reductoisomerase
VLNAANEVAVARFLAEEIGFLQIPELVDAALQAHRPAGPPTLEAIAEADAWARRHAQRRETLSRA